MRFFTAFALALAMPAQAPKTDQAPMGWSFATEGNGEPSNQKAEEYAIEMDPKVAHGGKYSLSLRSAVEKPTAFRSATQVFKADAYRGKRVRLTGFLKSKDAAEAAFWMRIDGPNSAIGFDNMDHRPVRGTTDWTRYEIVLDVPQSAMRLALGTLLMGAGQVWADDLMLEVVDPKQVKSTQLVQFTDRIEPRATNFDFETTGEPVSGWFIHGHGSTSYAQRLVDSGAHSGRTYLEGKSTGLGTAVVFSASQNFPATPFAGKRVRMRAYLKTAEVAKEVFLSLELWGKSDCIRRNTMGRGAKGTTGWQPQGIVVDVPADAEIVGIAAEMLGTGAVGVDDFSVEVVDPTHVTLSLESETAKGSREKRNKDLNAGYGKLSDRLQNLDFEG